MTAHEGLASSSGSGRSDASQRGGGRRQVGRREERRAREEGLRGRGEGKRAAWEGRGGGAAGAGLGTGLERGLAGEKAPRSRSASACVLSLPTSPSLSPRSQPEAPDAASQLPGWRGLGDDCKTFRKLHSTVGPRLRGWIGRGRHLCDPVSVSLALKESNTSKSWRCIQKPGECPRRPTSSLPPTGLLAGSKGLNGNFIKEKTILCYSVLCNRSQQRRALGWETGCWSPAPPLLLISLSNLGKAACLGLQQD
ncbi:uncharacterized protein LOC128570469 [Nycticebus coucang]|uniref:uncharacterized protein LOC128570469 n=1 Tax=Nycticebus coucang TaxID=9470 RepID=UPI00234C9B2D|nr:uncharacterized protein LOC128570469 [Nycticebus coucang]